MNARRQTPKPPLTKWPARFHVTADVVALTIKDGVLQVAVVQRRGELACIDLKRNGEVREIKRDPTHHWALPGGHVDFEKDDIDEAAARELKEETGIEVKVDSLIQIGAYGKLGRDPRPGRTVSVAYLAFQPMFAKPIAGTDANQARFSSVLELLAEPNRLEFDHETMLIDAIQRARDLVLTTPIATSFCAPEFTLAELREVYEVLWHRAYDKDITNDDRQKFAKEVRNYTGDENFQFLSSLESSHERGLANRSFEPTNFSSSVVYSRIVHEMPELKYKLASMSEPTLQKISKMVISDAKRAAPKKPAIKERLDPANFSRKVINIPDFIEEIKDSEPRRTMLGTGRPAQLYRRGSAERLDPPLRLRVKRDSTKGSR
ncbi:MAG: NUDIX hydrolase [Acidimicrobiaceae bacterium]